MKTKKKILVSLIWMLLMLGLKANLFAQNCSINAGVDYSICLGETFRLDGSVGGPFNSSTLQWTVVSQPAGSSLLIVNPNSLLTNAGTSLLTGAYTFKLSATCGDGTPVQDQVTITVNPVPTVPTQSGTTSYSCYTGGPITISGTAPSAGETVRWTASGLGGTFSAPTSSSTSFTPLFPVDECGSSYKVDITYTIRNSSGCQRSVSRTYTFSRSYTLKAEAIPTPVCGTSTFLKGSCPGAGTALWSLVSKPAGAGDPIFSSASSRYSTVSGLIPGTYVFRYTVTGGCNAGSIDVTVNVAGSSGVTRANAGKDQFLCSMPSLLSLNGNTPGVGETSSWSLLSGGTSVVINTPNKFNTTVSGLTDAGAPYVFTYTIFNAGGCSSVDTVVINKIPELTLRNDDLQACYTTSGSNEGGVVTLGNFAYNQIDTIKVSVTYVSGPTATVGSTFVGGSSFNASIFTNNANITTNLGQTISQTFYNTGNILSPNELYLNRGADPTSNAYYLRNIFVAPTSAVGVYKLIVTYETKCSTYVANVTFYKGYFPSTGLVNAGTDIKLNCGVKTATLAGSLIDGLGYWTTVSTPSGATNPINVSNFTLRNPNLTGLIDGTYVFQYQNNAGAKCDNVTDQVKLVVASTPPPAPNAGIDQTLCAGTVTLAGSSIPNGALAQWTVVSPSGASLTFSDATISNPTVSGLLPNTVYTFRYTLSNGCGSSFDDVVITTTSNTGPSQPTLTGPFGFTCGWSPTQGNFPRSYSNTFTIPALTGTQSGTISMIANPPSALTSWSVTGSTATTRTLSYTLSGEAAVSVVYCLSDAVCATQTYCDTLSQYYFSNLPVDFAGTDQNLCSISSYPAVAILTGYATNIPVKWSLIYSSNGQGVAFGSPNSSTTTVTLPANGTYKFQYQIIGLEASCQLMKDYVTITTSTPGSLAYAGNDTTVCGGNGVFPLHALPLTSGTGTWSVENIISGTTPIIANPSQYNSNITFAQSGQVVLRWSSYGSNTACGPSSSDLVTITYIAPAKAGNDITACNITSTILKAVNPSPATGIWLQISGPSSATFGNASSYETVVSNLVPGNYIFRWTVTSGSCSSTDDVAVNITTLSTVANAGPDFSLCNGSTNDKIILNATAAVSGLTGTWSLISVPTGATAGTFSNINDAKATYSGANTAGQYVFSWTLTDGTCSSTDFVTVTVDPSTCLTITGTVFNDANTNTIINVGENGTTADTTLYVYLVNPSGIVVDSANVLSNGTYTLNASPNTTYTIELSTTKYPVGTNVNTTPISNTPPSGWVTTGENGAGNTGSGDGTPNGVLAVTTVTTNVTQQNFGIQQPPVAVNDQSLNNPYGTTVTLNAPSNDSDTAPGTLDLTTVSLIVPVGATGVVTDGQGDVTSMTIPGEGTWTVNPTTGAVTFTPEIGFVGNPTVQQYTIDDNAGAVSNVATLTITYLSPIQITGTVFNDANGNTVINAGENGTTAGTNLYVYLVNGSGVVVDSAKVLSNGTYALQGSQNSSYTIELSTVQYPIGTDVNTTPISNTPPSGWLTTGENGAGNTGSGDGTPNGVLAVTTVTTNVTQQNFGIQQPPVAVNDQSLNNPYGTAVTINPLTNDSDAAPGTLDPTTVSLVVPVGATNVVTDAHGDVTSMTIPGEGTWTVNPTTGVITFTPLPGFTGNPTVQQYNIEDNAGVVSNNANLTITYLGPIQITGTVFDDANGNTVINAGENGTTAGTNLYVYLVNGSGVVVDSAKVLSNGTYALQGSQNSSYTIELSTVQYPIGTNVNTTPISNTPPSGWLTTGENGAGNTGSGDGTPNGVLAVTTVTTNVTQQNFGIEQPPVANNVTAPSQINPGGSVQVTVPALNGTDAEDGVLSTGDIVTITTLPTTGTLYYNGVVVTVGQTIVNYDPTKLTVDPNDGNVTVVFTYTVTDAAGVVSAPATVTMPFTNNVPVANPDFSTTYVNIPVTVPVLKNDTFGADGPSVGTITITDNANHGNAVVNNGGTPNDPTDDKIVYTPNVGYAGNDTLIYQICDINGDCDTAIVIIAISVGAPLPVALQSFDAQQTTENIVDVTWMVGQELSIKLYEVQKSTDGLNFQTVGRVNATGASSYAYRDMARNIGDAYYRLKIVEQSGKESFSPIRKLGYKVSSMIGIYPNPASIYVNVTLPKEWRNKKVVMMLYNQAGQEMLRKVVQYSQATERIDLSVKIPAGIYHLKLQDDKNTAERKVIVVR